MDTITPINGTRFIVEQEESAIINMEEGKDHEEEIENKFNIHYRHPFQHIVTCYTHFLMVACFEIIFFFEYAAPYEKKSIFRMIDSFIDSLFETYDKFFDDDSIYNNSDYINKVCDSGVSFDNNDQFNYELYVKNLYMMSGFIFGLIVLILIEISILKLPSHFLTDLKYSMLTVTFIAIFDYFFFTTTVTEYKMLNTGEVACHIAEDYFD